MAPNIFDERASPSILSAAAGDHGTSIVVTPASVQSVVSAAPLSAARTMARCASSATIANGVVEIRRITGARGAAAAGRAGGHRQLTDSANDEPHFGQRPASLTGASPRTGRTGR